jgi:hypothetical protein
MARMTLATQEQKDAYNDGSHVYPLHGYVKVDGRECEVERCGNDKDNPQYEVMAPAGFHFDPDFTHTLLCFTVKDLDERTRMNSLEACTEACREQ